MEENALWHKVRELRTKGYTPKQIARALSAPPAEVARIVRAIAAESAAEAPEPGVLHCLINVGWSYGLTVERGRHWRDPDPAGNAGGAGLATVIVARRRKRDMLSTCCYLVDTYCLGVKNTIGPRTLSEDRFAAFARQCYASYESDPVEAPIELAQHIVLGAVEYARKLGFEPHRDFARARGHLGEMDGPCAIRFGRNGKPTYVQGPHDDPLKVMRTLNRSVGKDNYDFTFVFADDPGTFAR
jgi:hypothetical protein